MKKQNNRDYHNLDLYYEELLADVYPQPMDGGHLQDMTQVIVEWIEPLGIQTVLDAGCGYGEAKKIFNAFGISYMGVSLAEDPLSMSESSYSEDFNFLGNVSADLVFSRHSLEHSPFPLLTLMEWHRVSNKWLCLVLPNPDHYTYVGRNHYSVMTAHHAAWILRRAGWKMNKFFMNNKEIWFLCEKMPRIGSEGWTAAPVSNVVYELERDLSYGYLDVAAYFEQKEEERLFQERKLAKLRKKGRA